MEGTYPTMYICMYVLEVEVYYICANKDTIALALFQLGCVTLYTVAVTKVIPFYLVGISK